jgi:hypothetical protein
VALCAPSSTAAGVPVATRCSGTVKVGSVMAGSIRTTKVSCTRGKTVIRTLLAKAASSAACRRAADRPAPSTGCVVSGYHCFRKRTPDYCATTSGKLVQWREAICSRASRRADRAVKRASRTRDNPSYDAYEETVRKRRPAQRSRSAEARLSVRTA